MQDAPAPGATAQCSLTTTRCERLILHRVGSPSPTASSPVLLAHGTLSNHRSLLAMARYLAAQRAGECWLLDFEGHGASAEGRTVADFESVFSDGAAAALTFLAERSGRTVHWVGHSGGGLAPLLAIARQPELASKLASLVMCGSQAAGAGRGIGKRMALRLSDVATRWLGRVPANFLGIGPEGEAAGVMRQWFGWNLDGQWLGRDGFDYVAALRLNASFQSVPRLALAGSGDWYIAPATACEALHKELGGATLQFEACGLESGWRENYSHARLVASRNAAHEVWPLIDKWLRRADESLQ